MTEFGYLGSLRVFKYKFMYEHRRRQSLKLHMFFKIKFLLYTFFWGKPFHSMTGRARSLWHHWQWV